MSFFPALEVLWGIGGVLAAPFTGGASLALTAAGAGIGAIGANQDANSAARAQMDFQNTQSSTAYQRAVMDMKAAGINPMLAAQVGGASSGSGAMPPIQNAGGAVASAQSAAAMESQIANTQANTLKTLADTDMTKAGMPLKKFENQLPDLGNQIIDRVKNVFNNSANSAQSQGDISVSDLPPLGGTPSSAEAAGLMTTGASETAGQDWLTQLSSLPMKAYNKMERMNYPHGRKTH